LTHPDKRIHGTSVNLLVIHIYKCVERGEWVYILRSVEINPVLRNRVKVNVPFGKDAPKILSTGTPAASRCEVYAENIK
jgi:hypothetical protein